MLINPTLSNKNFYTYSMRNRTVSVQKWEKSARLLNMIPARNMITEGKTDRKIRFIDIV